MKKLFLLFILLFAIVFSGCEKNEEKFFEKRVIAEIILTLNEVEIDSFLTFKSDDDTYYYCTLSFLYDDVFTNIEERTDLEFFGKYDKMRNKYESITRVNVPYHQDFYDEFISAKETSKIKEYSKEEIDKIFREATDYNESLGLN